MARFIVDTMLGKLATYLRMCGHDAAYSLDEGLEADDAILAAAEREGRTLVTRDVSLSDRAPDAVLVESREIEGQLAELAAARYDISLADEPGRCGVCNAPLDRVGSAEYTPADVPDPVETAMWQCPDCGQYFWRGSHWDRVGATLDRIG